MSLCFPFGRLRLQVLHRRFMLQGWIETSDTGTMERAGIVASPDSDQRQFTILRYTMSTIRRPAHRARGFVQRCIGRKPQPMAFRGIPELRRRRLAAPGWIGRFFARLPYGKAAQHSEDQCGCHIGDRVRRPNAGFAHRIGARREHSVSDSPYRKTVCRSL
jgi:hypothetical protein